MGKIHGGLTRAGKVKGQTPKKAKVEKRKTSKGRARKRVLYNKRFVNAQVDPSGKKLSPNSFQLRSSS